MHYRREEIPHNTDEQVTDYVRRALAIMDDAEVPGGMRGAAFPAIFGAVASKQIQLEAVGGAHLLSPRIGNGGH